MSGAAALIRRYGLVAICGIIIISLYLHHVHVYWFLSDDGYISFRYARNLVDGLGLVWNAGEPVEGYTNFLWVILIALGMMLGVEPEWLTPLLGVAAGLAVLGTITALEARVRGWSDPRILLTPAVLAVHKSFCGWSTSGLETMLFAALVLAAAVALTREHDHPTEAPYRSSLLFALATLTRPDGGLFMIVAGFFVLWDVLCRRRTLRSAVLWGLPYLAIVGAHMLWRHGYYGAWLPNTFYAKVTVFSWPVSRAYFERFLTDYQLHWFVPFWALGWFARRDHLSAVLGVMTLVCLAYITYVRGDFLEYRFMVVLFAPVIWFICRGLALLLSLRVGSPVLRWLGIACGACGYAALVYTTYRVMGDKAASKTRAGSESIEATRSYGQLRAEQGKALRHAIDRGQLPASLRIATGAAGALPYYSEVWVLDFRGLNDTAIARQPVRRATRVGHDRQATLKYIQSRDAVVHLLDHKIIYRGGAQARKSARASTLKWMQHYNAQHTSRGYELRQVCLELGPNEFMIFGTNVSQERLDAMLGHLSKCPRSRG